MLRIRPLTALVLALAFIAGPVSAACLHGLDHGMDHAAVGHEVPVETGHEMPMHGAPAEEPCHDTPPAPEPVGEDCDAPCCTAEPTLDAPSPPSPSWDLAAAAAVLVDAVSAPETATPAVVPKERRSPPLRRHVELQRFLI